MVSFLFVLQEEWKNNNPLFLRFIVDSFFIGDGFLIFGRMNLKKQRAHFFSVCFFSLLHYGELRKTD